MAVMRPQLLRMGDSKIVWAIGMSCSFTLVSTIVYFSWATAPFGKLKIAEIVGLRDNQVFVDNQPTKSGVAFSTGQQLLTQNARVGLQQGEQIVARVGEQSSATLETDCLQLGEGQLVVASTTGCVGAAIVRSQDGVVVLERLGTLGEVKVLAGQVTIGFPSNPAIGEVKLTTNQKITFSLTGDEAGPIRLMLPAEVSAIISGNLFQDFAQAIANQKTIAGLPPPSPSPGPTVTPIPTAKPVPTDKVPTDKVPKVPTDKVPTDKVPTDKVPSATSHPQPVTFRTAPQPPAPSQSARSDPDWGEQSSPPSAASSTRNYSRPVRRRRYVEPSSDPYTYRRKWPRSPAASTYYRRRTPTYAPPSDPAPTHPAPVGSLPTVPEISPPEMPTPIESAPIAPPMADPLPTVIEAPPVAPGAP
ncbi:MAG: hypothetical protein NW220_23390 [Leptolyngbyaceae cyanobacterium bins.349]|nr:hypothetical protein [Leptolyngbyaceae cyanobacterium bins.349]